MRIILGISYLIVALVDMLFGFFVFQKNRRNPLNIHFALTAFFSGFYAFCSGMNTLVMTHFWHAATWFGFLVIPSAITLFRYFMHNEYRNVKLEVIFCYVPIISYAFLAYTPLVLRKTFSSFPTTFIPGPLDDVLRSYTFVLLLYLIYIFIRQYFSAIGHKKIQVKYFLLGSFLYAVVAIVFSMVLPLFGVQSFIDCSALFSIIWVVFVTYAIVKHQLMDIKVVITRVGIFLFVYTLVLGLPLFVGYKYGLWKHSTWIMLIFASTGPLIYNYLRKQIEGLLLQEQKHKFIEEEQIRRQRATDHFSASLAHEIDNPICAISGIAEVMKMKVLEDLDERLNDKEKEYFKARFSQLITDAGRISKMVKAIREFSSKTSGELTDVLIDDVVDGFMNIVGPQFKFENINFEQEIEKGIKLHCNKIHLEEVLINLSVNAIHAVRENDKENKTVKLKIYKNTPNSFRIELSDNGYGIEEKMLEDIFLDFVTSKASTVGIGIGLARVRKIVQNYKGKVWARSDGPGKGAVFFVELACRS